MKKLIFVLALIIVSAVVPACTTGYDEAEKSVTPEQTSDPDTGTTGGGPSNPPPTGD